MEDLALSFILSYFVFVVAPNTTEAIIRSASQIREELASICSTKVVPDRGNPLTKIERLSLTVLGCSLAILSGVKS